MLIREFRIVLPLTVEEYQIAQLWSVSEFSKENTGGGEGVQILKNIPFKNRLNFTDGQYTHKIFHLKSKIPWWIRKLAPKGSTEFHEKAWNAYPYCQTVITNPDYMNEDFSIKVESFHSKENGQINNVIRVFDLSPEQLTKRKVIRIDIVNDPIPPEDYKEDEDPAKFLSEKTGRGLLLANWKDTTQYSMCVYKLCTVEFKWFGLQEKVERYIQKTERRLFTKFHRQIFCWIDKWHGLSIEEIREIEEDTRDELAEKISRGVVRGMQTTTDETLNLNT